MKGDVLWEAGPRVAVGAEDGEVDIHVAGNSVSSSVLQMLNAHSAAAPGSGYVGIERVPMRRLDTIGFEFVRPDSVVFLKIDTQGYEREVLRGASELIRASVGCQLELSLVPLYESQALYAEMLNELQGLGFDLWSIVPAFVDPKSGRLLQVDATFFRQPK